MELVIRPLVRFQTCRRPLSRRLCANIRKLCKCAGSETSRQRAYDGVVGARRECGDADQWAARLRERHTRVALRGALDRRDESDARSARADRDACVAVVRRETRDRTLGVRGAQLYHVAQLHLRHRLLRRVLIEAEHTQLAVLHSARASPWTI